MVLERGDNTPIILVDINGRYIGDIISKNQEWIFGESGSDPRQILKKSKLIR